MPRKLLIPLILAACAGCKTTTTEEYTGGVQFADKPTTESTVLDARLRQLEKLAQEYPKRSDIPYQMAGVYYQKEAYRDSAKALQRAIYIEPNESRYHYHLGRVYLKMGELDSAEKSFRRAIDLMPDRFTGARGALGYVYCLKGKWNEALQEFETCRRIDPKDLNAYYYIGCIHDVLRNRELAVQNFKDYLRLGGTTYRTKSLQILSSYGEAPPEIQSEEAEAEARPAAAGEDKDLDLGDFPKGGQSP